MKKRRPHTLRWFALSVVVLALATAGFYKGARMMGQSWAEVMVVNPT